MPKHFSTVRHHVWLPYRFALGPTLYRWFEGLKEEKIWGTRCPRCRKVLVPARSFCPGCGVAMDEWLEIPHEGDVVTWTRVSKAFYGAPVTAPFVSVLVRLDGTDCGFLHVAGGIDAAAGIKRGARVRAVWNPEKKGRLLDLQYFEPVG